MAALALVQATATPAPDARGQEVVVIARKLKDWRAKWTSSNGKVRCKTVQSTGDADVDAIGCDAITACAPAFEQRAVTLAKDKTFAADERKQATGVINRELGRCMTDKRDALVEELAARRAAAREQGS